MRYTILILFYLCISINSNASDSLKCKKPNKVYLEIAGGLTNSLFGGYYEFLSNRTADYNISPISNFRINAGYRLIEKDCKVRHKVVHFLSIGVGINFFNYFIKRRFTNRDDIGHTSNYNYEYEKPEYSYTLNKLNYSVFINSGAIYPKGFFIRNSFGASYSTYLNKNIVENKEHKYGTALGQNPIYITPSNPNGYYTSVTDEYNIIKEKNYYSDDLNVFYNLNVGYKIKRVIPFAYSELNFLNENFNTFCSYGLGMLIFL